MTFYEAALQILTREGKPLHATAITELAVKENLLSHVGRQPELTMASRLAAMARRASDRRLQAVEPDVFGLMEWNVPAQPDALEQSGQPEPHDENEPPLRERERHPRVSRDHIRSTGRNDRRRRDDGERRRHQAIVQPLQEILDKVARWAPLGELAAVAREHGLLTEELATDALAEELLLENERREGDGKKPMFVVDGSRVCLRVHVEAAGAATGPLAEALVAAAKAVVEARAARPVEVAPAAIAVVPGVGIEALLAAEEQRVLGQLRKRVGELDLGGFEALVRAAAAAMGYEDVRTARRGKEGPLLLAQRRMGVVPLRFVLKLVRGTRPIRREDVQEVRKDLQSLSAPMGVIFSAAEVTREARSEAQQGGGVVLLLCGDAFAAQLAEKGVGVQKRTVELIELDEASLQRIGRTAESPAPAPGRNPEAAGEPVAGNRPRETPEERRERRERERREWREQRELDRLARRAAAMLNDARRFWDPEPAPVEPQPAGAAPAEAGAAPEAAPDEAVTTAPEALPAAPEPSPTPVVAEAAPAVAPDADAAPTQAEPPVGG